MTASTTVRNSVASTILLCPTLNKINLCLWSLVSYHPGIQWSQDEFRIFLAVQICGCHKDNIDISICGSYINFQ